VGTKILMASEGNVSEKSMMGMKWVRKYHWSMRDLFYPSFAGTLTFVTMIETFVESLRNRTRMIHTNGSFLLFW
jgi:hypothetical protein